MSRIVTRCALYAVGLALLFGFGSQLARRRQSDLGQLDAVANWEDEGGSLVE
jgi:hypothetical protein